MSPAGPSLCHHCSSRIKGAPIVEQLNGEEKKFCCHGCACAFSIITGAGLGDFYRRRDWRETGVEREIFDLAPSETTGERFMVAGRPDQMAFAVGNVRCAACVWLIERLLAATPGVRDVRGNFASHTFRVEFDPQEISPAEILRRVTRIGYRPMAAGGQDDGERRRELIRFATAAFFSSQLMVYSIGLYAGFFQGIAREYRLLLQFLSGLVATPVVLWCGLPFYQGALRGLKNRAPSMDLLVATGVSAAYLYSWVAFFAGEETWFEAAAMVVTLILLGRLLEESSRHRALRGIERLLSLAPQEATLLSEEGMKTVPADDLQTGDIILLRRGERLPVDVTLLDPEAEMDTGVVNGEALPALIKKGDSIAAGCLNLGPAVKVEVVRPRETSFIARMAGLVEEGLARKAPVEKLADRVAAAFVPLVGLAALLTFFIHLQYGPAGRAVISAVSVLVVACPCALGLATPMAVTVAMGRAAQRGIIFRSGGVIERCAAVNMVALDKTGTITQGRPEVVRIDPAPGITVKEAIEIAAPSAALSTHPAARAVLAAARKEGIEQEPTGTGQELPGRGIVLNGKEKILLGSRRLLAEHGIDIPEETRPAASEIWLARDGGIIASFLLADALLPGAGETVRRLADKKITPLILSGDLEEVVKKAAEECGIEKFRAELTPEEKAAWIEQRQAEGDTVLMVGDGINDAPALATARVSGSFVSASDIAVATSDIIFPAGGITLLTEGITLCRQTMRIIRQNLAWAFSYNLIAIPLAATGLLAPAWAAALMTTSSILVVANSARIRRVEPICFNP